MSFAMAIDRASQTGRLSAGKPRKADRRAGVWAEINRCFGQLSLAGATAILLVFAVTVAVGLNWALGQTGIFSFDLRVMTAAIIVTVMTATPIIVYSQIVIRELKSSRRTLRLMTERLALAFDNAERANDAKSRFLANMSHELRTPLNAIIGFSDIMQNELLGAMQNPRYLGYAADINASGQHLLAIINEILDLAKIESGQETTENEEEFDLLAAAEVARTMVRPLAERQRVALDLVLPPFDVRLVAVARMIRQIMINILSNALKFTPEGGSVVLLVELRDNGNLVVSITDTGVGMSAEDLKVALTPFGQVPNAQSGNQPGTGLGLPLAKAMMDLHGGRLVVRSKPGEGTTIALVFPASRVHADPARPALVARAS
ncbi:MAG: HAMP domain-containing sensor histidine kinase [Parvibaculum sp.]|uniref:sensor histidine kinase n=1 Tax=Parvibaculum sp. TaxID=2024848 RepID=UPI00284E52B2|nr:HAMP domain-containing sensor histidine kinase [Parvibaculum sp.]MDR3498052.1 HAMP domain-containing sensor histidine kinase [Parvibaculum sp.]